MTIENSVQATLASWQARVEEVRQRRLERGGGHAGLAHLHQVQGKTGLQVMTPCWKANCPTFESPTLSPWRRRPTRS
jgi:hypothetical protein